MKYLTIRIAVLFAVCFLTAVAATAQTAPVPANSSSQAKNLEINKFERAQDVNFPDSTIDVLMAQVVEQMKKLNKFGEVKLASNSQIPTTAPADGQTATINAASPETVSDTADSAAKLILSGTITTYKEGSRAKRYLVGFGAGKSQLIVQIKLVDPATGRVLLDQKVKETVVGGLFGGDGEGVSRGLAKGIADRVRKVV